MNESLFFPPSKSAVLFASLCVCVCVCVSGGGHEEDGYSLRRFVAAVACFSAFSFFTRRLVNRPPQEECLALLQMVTKASPMREAPPTRKPSMSSF